MKKQSIKTLLCASLLSITGGLSTTAFAGPLEETHVIVDADGVATARVPYVSSELATEEGRRQLQRRISRAAKDVCGPTQSREAGGLRIAARNKACYEDAVAIAAGQLEARQVASSAI